MLDVGIIVVDVLLVVGVRDTEQGVDQLLLHGGDQLEPETRLHPPQDLAEEPGHDQEPQSSQSRPNLPNIIQR